MYKQLKGICENCLRDVINWKCQNFGGVYRCEYATDRQVDIDELRKELKKN